VQLLHARVHGNFSTRGRYSAGTVRGTEWDTVDRCDGTLTVVPHGTVLVSDFIHNTTVAVQAGRSYLAAAPIPPPPASADCRSQASARRGPPQPQLR
jgi:hypothetical protein